MIVRWQFGVAAAICAAAAISYQFAPAPTTGSTRPSETSVVLEAANLDFGEAWEQARFGWVISVSNPSDRAVHVERFAKSCDCVAVEPEATTIPPRGSVSVKLNLDLRDKPNRPSFAGNRTFDAAITPVGTDIGRKRLVIHGLVKTPVIAEPNAFDFGESLIHGVPFVPRGIVVTPQLPMQEIQAEIEPADFGRVKVAPPRRASAGDGRVGAVGSTEGRQILRVGDTQVCRCPRGFAPAGRHTG